MKVYDVYKVSVNMSNNEFFVNCFFLEILKISISPQNNKEKVKINIPCQEPIIQRKECPTPMYGSINAYLVFMMVGVDPRVAAITL